MENRLTLKLFHPEVTYIPSAHILLSKTRHMAVPKFKRCGLRKRGALKTLVSASDVYTVSESMSEYPHAPMNEFRT